MTQLYEKIVKNEERLKVYIKIVKKYRLLALLRDDMKPKMRAKFDEIEKETLFLLENLERD